jgi:D-tyrosyl-tRNA(Tyr) deacylase
MKLVVQRVNKAKVVKVSTGEVAGEIEKGLFLLLGIKKEDSGKQVDELADKIVKLRIISDSNDKMNLSVQDTNLEILLVSQFTLYANTKDGNRPSFIDAEAPEKAKALYEYFIKKLKEKSIKLQTGSFGDYMKIETELDGPVTIVIEN